MGATLKTAIVMVDNCGAIIRQRQRLTEWQPFPTVIPTVVIEFVVSAKSVVGIGEYKITVLQSVRNSLEPPVPPSCPIGLAIGPQHFVGDNRTRQETEVCRIHHCAWPLVVSPAGNNALESVEQALIEFLPVSGLVDILVMLPVATSLIRVQIPRHPQLPFALVQRTQ
jgi:hypothetical protein